MEFRFFGTKSSSGAIAVLLGAVVAWSGTFFIKDFFVWDDPYIIYRAREVLAGHRSLLTPVAGLYYHSFIGLFVLTYKLFGLHPWGYHLVSLLLHFGITLSLYLLVEQALKSKAIALIAALCFVAAADAMEAVAIITNSCHLGAILLCALLLFFYLRWLNTDSEKAWRYFIAGIFCFVIALGFKLTAIVMPLVLLLIHILSPAKRRSLKGPAAFFLIAALHIPLFAFGSGGQVGRSYLGESWIQTGAIFLRLWKTLGFVLLPSPVLAWLGSGTGLLIGSTVLVAAILFYAFATKGPHRTATWAALAAYFIVGLPSLLAPISPLYGEAILPSRLRYYSEIPLCILKAVLLIALFDVLKKHLKTRKLPEALMAIALVAMVGLNLREYASRAETLRQQQQTLLMERFSVDLQANRQIVQRAGVVALIDFPNTALLSRLYASSSWVRLFTDSEVIASLAKAEIAPGESREWHSASGKSRRTGEIRLRLTTHTPQTAELGIPEPLQERPLLYVWYRPSEEPLFYSLGKPSASSLQLLGLQPSLR